MRVVVELLSIVRGCKLETAAESHIRACLPFLSTLLEDLRPITVPAPSPLLVPEAVVKTVTGQLLSAAAAKTIYGRLQAARHAAGLPGSWLLPHQTMRSCGLSANKARSLTEFAAAYAKDPKRIDGWKALDYENLVREVSSFWGLSRWSADILAIFHFGHTDVFPIADGSITRALHSAAEALGVDEDRWPIDAVRPHRTFLTMLLWKSVDTDYWSRHKRHFVAMGEDHTSN